MELVPYDVQYTLNHLRHCHGLLHFSIIKLSIYDMKCNKSRFVPRKLYLQSSLYNRQCFLTNQILMVVETLDLPQQCIPDYNPLLLSLNRKADMIHQCQIDIITQFLS